MRGGIYGTHVQNDECRYCLLIGSEKVKDTNTSGDQLLETNNINKSLLVLGECCEFPHEVVDTASLGSILS